MVSTARDPAPGAEPYPCAVQRFLALVCLCVAAVACSGDDVTPRERAHAIESQVWSPYCPGRLLIDCTTSQARELRGEIQRRIDGGEDSEDVIAWVRSEYGEEAIARPSATGGGLVIWLIPALFFAVGAAVVVRVVRRARVAAADV